SAAAASLRATTLNDEVGHDPMERQAVVVPLPGKPDEVVDRVRGELRVEIHDDGTAIRRDGRAVHLLVVDLRFGLCGHGLSSRWCVGHFLDGRFGTVVLGVAGAALPSSAFVTSARSWRA